MPTALVTKQFIAAFGDAFKAAGATGGKSVELMTLPEEKGARLSQADCDRIDCAFIDRDMWEKIVLNLLSNAVKFTLRGGKVTVEAAHGADGRVAIVTSDTGIGMTDDEIAKALTPFHRSESAFSRRFEGTGLGLPITKSLAEAHGAHLEITSRPGVGTRCAVIFPATRTLVA